MATEAGPAPRRDLILGLTKATTTNIGAPGMVAMSKIAPGAGPAFVQADLGGSWRVYIQRVESTKILGGTTQVGQSVFSATGAFAGASLVDVADATTALTTGSMTVAADGTVTGTLATGSGAGADRYEVRGALRAAKDLITGVVTVRVGTTTTFQGLVTMVREVTMLGFAQPSYQVTEGQPATVSVTRSGNMGGTVTVRYTAGASSGLLTFGPNVATRTFSITPPGDALINQGNRVVPLTLTDPSASALLGLASAALTVLDDDVPGTVFFDPATLVVPETGGSAKLTLRRTGGNAGGVEVTFRTVDGTAQAGRDYTGVTSGSVTFAANQTTQTVTVTLTNNQMVDGQRTFDVMLTGITSGGVLGSPSLATVAIRDDDLGGVVKITGPAAPVAEGGMATLTISRTGGAGGGVSVEWATSDVSAQAGSDYTAGGQTITFGPGELSRTITVQTLGDAAAEGDESFRVFLRNPIGLTLGTPASATVTIADAQQGFRFSAPDYRVTEGTAAALITVLRTGPTTGTVTARYATAPGTATPGADYTPTGGTLTFGPGVKQLTFTVPIANDTVAEGMESVLLTLSEPGGGALLGPQVGATLWILDNDLPGVLTLGTAGHTVAEAAGTVLVTVKRVGTAGGVTVSYRTQDGTAVAGQDYLEAQGTLTFGPGETTKTFTVRVLSDTLDEPAETFTVLLESPGGGATLGLPASALVTITDDDVPGVLAFSLATYLVPEGAGRATVVVTRTGGQAGGVTVDLEVMGGTAVEGVDWTGPLPGRLTFAPGEMSKSLVIALIDDAEREGSEAIFLRLANPQGGATLGAISTAAIVVGDSETGPIVTFSLERLTIDESARTATVSVVRSQAGAAQSVTLTVDVSASGGRVAPEAPRLIAFTPAQLSVPITLTIADNQTVQPDGQVTLTLSNPTPGLVLGSARTFVLTIRDNDALVQFAAASLATSVSEGAAALLTVERSGAVGTPVTVRWTAVSGTAVAPGDFAAASGVLTFAPGVTSQVIRIATANDVVPEGTETFTVALSAPTGGGVLGAQAAATVSIIPDSDAAGEFQLSADVAVLEGGVATLQVTRTAGQGGPVVVSYQTEDGTATVAGNDYIAKGGNLTFAPGVMSQAIMITTRADAAIEGPETFRVRLTLPPGSLATLGARDTATITLIDVQTARVQLGAPAYSVSEGAGALTIPVSRMGPTTQASTVQWSVTPGTALGGGIDYTAAGGTLTFPAGSTAAQSITIALTNDLLAEPTKTFTVVLGAPSAGTQVGAPGSALVTLADDDAAGQVQFGAAGWAVVEGQPALLTLLRTGGGAGGVEVGLVVEGTSTATAGQDYDTFAQTHTFGPGESMKAVAIPTIAGGLREGAEVLRLRLQVMAGGAVTGAVGTADLWIVDDIQTLRFVPAAAALAEGATATVTVARSGTTSGTVTVGYRVFGGTATNGADYTLGGTGTLTFQPGVGSLTFPVATVNDTALEGPETVILELFDPFGAALDPDPGRFTLTILDNERPDLAVVSVGAPTQAGTGLPVTPVVTVRNLSAAAAPATTLDVFLSTTATPGSGTRLATVTVAALAGGAAVTLTPIVNVPPGLAGGDYFVSAVVNPLGALAEETLANNGAAALAATRVIELRPDLIVTSVPAPGGTLTGKLLSSPLHVRNAGPAASGPFRVGVFLSQNQSGQGGLLLAIRDMPSLAPGTGADVPLSINLPDDLPQGDYYLTGVADLLGAVSESDEINNAMASPVAFRVTRNLTKLSRVSASFQTQFAGCDPQIAGRNLSLTGTLNLTSQTGTTGLGTITLTGSPDGISSVTFRGSFSATVLPDDTVMIAFSVSASGAFTGTATATGTGAITNGILNVDPIAGTLTVTGVGVCPFTGSLEVRGEIALFFSLLAFAEGGVLPPNGTGSATPVFQAPLAISEGSLGVAVLFDPAPPIDPFFVRFTGPAGSGVTNVPADSRLAVTAGSFYETDTGPIAGRNLVGTWSVNYGGRFTRTFAVGNPEQEARFIAMLPTFARDASGRVTAVSWVFKDRRTGATVPAPPHADSIQVELVGSFGADASPDFPRTTTTHTLPSPVPYSQIDVVYISFKDTLTGNFYVTTYRR